VINIFQNKKKFIKRLTENNQNNSSNRSVNETSINQQQRTMPNLRTFI